MIDIIASLIYRRRALPLKPNKKYSKKIKREEKKKNEELKRNEK
jgi:hypothetical protein